MDGRNILEAWAADAGDRWSVTPSGKVAYRLCFRGASVLYCYNATSHISAFVEKVTIDETEALLRFGPSPGGYDPRRKGIRLSVSAQNLAGLLLWVRLRYERGDSPRSLPVSAVQVAPSSSVRLDEAPAFSRIADEIYGCACRHCPVFPRIDTSGYFPKFGAGGRGSPKLAIVTMNPGDPDREQFKWTRASLARGDMHSLYEQGLVAYHRQHRGGGIDLPAFIEAEAGVPWQHVYYTELAKCVTLRDERNIRRKVLDICSLNYFASELLSFREDLRFVVCFGADAFRSTEALCARTPELRALVGAGRLLAVRHPANDYHGEFVGQFRSALRSVRRDLGL
jgi:hypothetical protein